MRPPEGARGQAVGHVTVRRAWDLAEGPCGGVSATDTCFPAFACVRVVPRAFDRDSHCRDFVALVYFRPCSGLSFDLRFAGQLPPPFAFETCPCGGPGCWQWVSEMLCRGHLPVPRQHRVGTPGWSQHGHQTPCRPKKGREGPWQRKRRWN